MSSSGNTANERLAAALAEMPEVRLGYLYGSRATGRSRDDSDFDIALLVDEETARDELSDLESFASWAREKLS